MIQNQSSLKDQLHGIYDTWHVPFWQTSLFRGVIFACAGLVFLLIMVAVWRWFKARREHRILSPWQQALNVCAVLDQEACATREQGELLYCTLTGTLKTYINQRYEYDVAGRTDDELLAFLAETSFPKPLLNELADIVTGAKTVKFANETAMKDAIERHVKLAKHIVVQTIPQKK